MWHVHGPDLNTSLPLGQQLMSRLLDLIAVTWADVDQTKESDLPTGSKHGRCCSFFKGQGLI